MRNCYALFTLSIRQRIIGLFVPKTFIEKRTMSHFSFHCLSFPAKVEVLSSVTDIPVISSNIIVQIFKCGMFVYYDIGYNSDYSFPSRAHKKKLSHVMTDDDDVVGL